MDSISSGQGCMCPARFEQRTRFIPVHIDCFYFPLPANSVNTALNTTWSRLHYYCMHYLVSIFISPTRTGMNCAMACTRGNKHEQTYQPDLTTFKLGLSMAAVMWNATRKNRTTGKLSYKTSSICSCCNHHRGTSHIYSPMVHSRVNLYQVR